MKNFRLNLKLSRELAETLPDARFEVVPAAGHVANLDNPAAFNQHLLDGHTIAHMTVLPTSTDSAGGVDNIPFITHNANAVHFDSVFEEIVRKNQARDISLPVTFRPQRECETKALAEISANKRSKPGATALRYRDDNRGSSGKFARAATKITARPPSNSVSMSRA